MTLFHKSLYRKGRQKRLQWRKLINTTLARWLRSTSTVVSHANSMFLDLLLGKQPSPPVLLYELLNRGSGSGTFPNMEVGPRFFLLIRINFPMLWYAVNFFVLLKHVHQMVPGQSHQCICTPREGSKSLDYSIRRVHSVHHSASAPGRDPLTLGDWAHYRWWSCCSSSPFCECRVVLTSAWYVKSSLALLTLRICSGLRSVASNCWRLALLWSFAALQVLGILLSNWFLSLPVW